MPRDCLSHGIWIETRMTGVFAADDFVNVTSIATSTACQLECRIRREDCQGLPQTQPPRVPGGHEAIHATVDLDAVDSMPSGNTLRPETTEFWQSPSLAPGWPLEIDVTMCLCGPTTRLSTFRTLRNRCRLSFRFLAKARRCCGVFLLQFCMEDHAVHGIDTQTLLGATS